MALLCSRAEAEHMGESASASSVRTALSRSASEGRGLPPSLNWGCIAGLSEQGEFFSLGMEAVMKK